MQKIDNYIGWGFCCFVLVLFCCFFFPGKVWQLGSSSPNFTLEGHEKGVNCIDYYSGGDKPYLISGADDRLVKIWDYQVCVQLVINFCADCHSKNIVEVIEKEGKDLSTPTDFPHFSLEKGIVGGNISCHVFHLKKTNNFLNT